MHKPFSSILLVLLCLTSSVIAQTSKDTIFESVLDLNIEELMNTKVSIATKSEISLNETPSIVSVITSEQIRNIGARDLRDVLRTIPGFQLGMRDLGYTTIGIRGIATPNSEKVMIMIDGIPINENLEGSGTVVFADMVLDNVERIEIIRGPGSALYGANAFMAVINIILKKANDIDGVIASVKGGSYKTLETSIIAGKEIGDFEVNAFFDYLSTDGSKQKIEIDALTNDPDNSNISLAGTEKGYTHLFRNKLTSSLNIDYKGFYSKSLFISTKKGDYVGATSSITENSEAQHFQAQQIIGFQYDFSDKLYLNVHTTYLLYSVDNLLNLYPPGYGDIFTEGYYQKMGGKQQNINFNAQLNYKLFERNTLQIGASYAFIKYFNEINMMNTPGTGIEGLVDAPPFFDTDEVIRRVSSVYIQDNWKLNKMVSITIGGRLDHYSDAGITINPRAALVFNPIKKLNIKLLYGSAFRAPTFVETYFNGAPYLAGDKNIKPETINSYEAYIALRPNKIISVSVNYFYNNITNLITTLPDSNLVIGKYGNSEDEINVQGFESEFKILLSQTKSYIFLSYAFQKGVNSKTNEDIVGMANHTAFGGINHNLTKNWNINLNANYIGARKRATNDTRETLNGFTLLNLSILKKNIINNLDIQISGYNLLNSDFRVPDNSGLIYNDYPLQGISFFGEIRYKF